MSARRRIASRRGWPANLYQNGQGYYWFKNPVTGEPFGLGRDFKVAVSQVRTANAELERRKGSVDLIHRIDRGTVTLAKWCDTFEEEYKEGVGRKENTLKTVHHQLNSIRNAPFAGKKVGDVSTKEIADWIKAMAVEHPTMASLVRTRAMRVFRSAEANGLIELGKNPVTPTDKPDVVVTRARMTIEDFKAILAVVLAADGMRWMAMAMFLALVTGQRREDIVKMQFAQVRDGYLWVKQSKGKTGHESKVRIPLEVYLPAIEMSIDDVIKMCRDDIVSKHVIHHTRNIARSKPGHALTSQSLSMVFAQYRELAEIAIPEGKTPITFHEIRSLSARLYADAYGNDFAQALLGHKSGKMTALYRDSRGQEWTEVKFVAG